METADVAHLVRSAAAGDRSAWEQLVEELRRRLDVICAKNRGGAAGTDHQECFIEFDHIRDHRE